MFAFRGKKMDKLNKKFIFSIFNKAIVMQIILAIIFTGLFFGVVANTLAPEMIDVRVGDISPKDIRAPKDIVDEDSTEELREAAREGVEPSHDTDPTVQVKMKNKIKNYFQAIIDIKNSGEKNISKQINIIRSSSELNLDDEQNSIALKMDVENLTALESNISDIITQIMSPGIQYEELENGKENVIKIFESLDDLSKEERELGITIINSSLSPNRFLDVEVTEQKRQEAESKVEPVIIEKNQIIVHEGDNIDEIAYNLIKKIGLLKEEGEIPYKTLIGSFLFVVMMEALIVAYLYIFNREVLNSSKLLILAIVILSTIVMSQGLNSIDGYLMPISVAAMLISLIIDAKLAILVNFIMVITIGVITGSDLNTLITLLIGGSVGVYGVIHTQQRYNIFLTGVIVSVAHVISILSFGLIGDVEIQQMLTMGLYGVLNGLFCAILTVGSLPLWENFFGIITPLKLLELSNPNQPLLKKLLLEAPGTYHHSILVGNLSEAASDAIKANSLIARVGSYYHDVGKLKRPYFFRENQINGENPHDKINPNLSTLIITNHVKDGVEMAKKYNIPLPIRDIISQHHGETIVAYFYHKAINEEDPELVQEKDFRYEGPKPQFKEAAIIMLADSVEAAVRSMQEPTKGKIDGLVRKIIKDKLNDGQLDECDLTLRDLDLIARSFVKVLMGIFHERIEYPELDLKELKGAK